MTGIGITTAEAESMGTLCVIGNTGAVGVGSTAMTKADSGLLFRARPGAGGRRCDTHDYDRRVSFFVDSLGNCAIAFPIRPHMRQNARTVTSGP